MEPDDLMCSRKARLKKALVGRASHGGRVTNLARCAPLTILACLDDAIRALATERIEASLWVVEPGRVRIRDHPMNSREDR